MRHKRLIVPLLLAAISLAVLLPGTASMSLWDRDEACNAQCAREMLERQDPIVPTFDFRLRTDKPPLEYWAMMASYRLLGVREFAARLPSVLFSTGTVLLIFFFVSRLWDTQVGILASLVMLSNFLFLVIGRAATPDPTFLFFLTLSLFLFMTDKITLAYGAAGLAVLAKGPLGILIPLGTECLYLLFSEGIKAVKKVLSLKGILLFLVISMPWYIAVGLKTHGQFLEGFILYHNITRFLRPIGGHRGPIFYYIPVLILAFFPWTPLLPQTLYHLYQKAKDQKGKDLFLYIWCLFPFAFFSLAKTKLPNYILPLCPALSTAIASEASQWSKRETKKVSLKIPRATLATFVLITLVPLLAGLFFLFSPALVLVALLSLILGTITFWKTGKKPITWYRYMALLVIALMIVIPPFILPNLEAKKLSPSFSHKIEKEIKAGDLIVTYPFSMPSLVFYTNHKVIREKKRSRLRYFLTSHRAQRIFIVTKLKKLKSIKGLWKGKIRVLEVGDSFYPHGRLLLSLLSPNPPPRR